MPWSAADRYSNEAWIVAAGDWQALQLQAVLFFAGPAERPDVYSSLTGAAPDSQEDRPKEGLRIQSGKLGDKVLQVLINPVRLDIYLGAPAPTEVQLGMPPPTFGKFDAELSSFAEMVNRWLPRCQIATSRLALVTKALAPAESGEAAYEILKANLSSVKVETTMKDLLFRVNWKAETKLMPEGYLNRLTTWSALMFNLTAGPPADPGRKVFGTRFYAQREIDVNTPAEHAEQLPPDQLAPIFEELVRVVAETAATGETP